MKIKPTTPSTLDNLWQGITIPRKQRPARVNEFIKRGCALNIGVEDYLYDVGVGWADPHSILEALGIKMITLFGRPRAGKDEAFGFEGLTLSGLAMMMIQLQSYGIAADPQPLVDVLRPALTKQTYLTHEELRIYWHKRENKKMFVKLNADGPIEEPKQFTTPAGYRCVLDNDLDNNGILIVAGPRTLKKKFEGKLLDSGIIWERVKEVA